MSAASDEERRRYPRYSQAVGVQFHHESSHRDFPGRCVDMSMGGLRMYVPAATPARTGHHVRLSLGAVRRPELSGLNEQTVRGTIVRVDRRSLLSEGHLAVAVQFAHA